MKLVCDVHCFHCSSQEFSWSSPDQFPLSLVSPAVVGIVLVEKRGLRSPFAGDGKKRRWPLRFSLDKFATWSYLSHLSIYLAPESGKFYILVDNRPWLKDLVSRSTHWWQLMVTKSRLSPFANTRGMKAKKMIQELSELQASSSSDARESRNFRNWFSFIDAVMLSRNKVLLPVKKLRNTLIANSNLHRTLYGFIMFEVSWSDVRGINYFNELQTDTSFAIEAKIMRRWEFDSIGHAARSISSWFPGTLKEQTVLKEHLEATTGEDFYDAQENFPGTTETNINNIITDDMFAANDSLCSSTRYIINRLQTPPSHDGPYKRRKVMRSIDTELEKVLWQASDPRDSEETLQPSLYRDVLILFRFNDRDLPFKLKDTIMSQLWLLTLLEAGLPSWVIFLQSYPGLCRLYRPWMCPLARVLYVLISVITVLIGFYDMYKNVPLLKATASHLFGPLFDWIEEWEMISRIKYLGTMLFIHNFQKAFKWFLTVTRIIFSIFSFFIQPIAQPFAEFLHFFLPLWSIFIKLADNSFALIWMVVEFSVTLIGDFVEILLLPLWYILVVAWNVVLGFCSIVAFLCTFIYELVGDLWLTARGIFQFTKGVESAVSSYEVSVWRSLWDDLFSQVFRALRSIFYGFVAFFTACNRHRLSIYNHVEEFIQRLLRTVRAWSKENHRTQQTSESQITARGRRVSRYRMRPRKVTPHPCEDSDLLCDEKDKEPRMKED